MSATISFVLLTLGAVMGVGFPDSQQDTLSLNEMAAAMLGACADPESVVLSRRDLPFFSDAELFEATAPECGYHYPFRALLARLGSGQLIPLGCVACRRVLVRWSPPKLERQDYPAYAALLASLDGKVGGVASVITQLDQLPRWMRERAEERNIQLGPPTIRPRRIGSYEVYEVVVSVLAADVLYEVNAYIGVDRLEDGIQSVRALVGQPPA